MNPPAGLATADEVRPTSRDPFECAPGAVWERSSGENFPVALGFLARADRERLRSIYGFARFVDDLGDEAEVDRLAALRRARRELEAAVVGGDAHPVIAAAARLAGETGIGTGPFVDLIEANVLDQHKSSYATFDELLAYCGLSANPVGRLVLAAFSSSDRRCEELSDAVCSGLQIVEHLQDVAEDHRRGRVYLPEEDLVSFGVDPGQLAEPSASPGLRRLVAFEAARARRLLESGIELVSRFSGRRALALAGFAGGGLAQLDALADADFDVLARPVKATKAAVARRALSLAVAARRRS